jgi:hypothetical protein
VEVRESERQVDTVVKSVNQVEMTSAEGVGEARAPHKPTQELVALETEENQTVAMEAMMVLAEMLVI